MLRSAQLYKDELNEKMIESWYKPENIFYHGGTGEYTIDLPDNNKNRHDFVSVNEYNEVIGYISYNVDWEAMVVNNLGIISFDNGNLKFVKDLYQIICDVFEIYHMNKIEFFCYADNPALRGYRNFIKKHGGKECGYFRQVAKLRDGQLHDSVCFEIMADEFYG